MTREDDFIGQVESYLDEYEGMTPLPDAVRNAVRAHLPETRQLGRFGGPMRRFDFMNNNFVRAGIAAAAVVLAVIVGIKFLPGANTGGPPEATPTPPPALLARGSFTGPGNMATELDASGDGSSVTGTMTVSGDGGRATVDLECTRTTEGGLLVIGGTVSQSTAATYPEGSLFAIILQRGPPVRALFMFEDASKGPCPAFLGGDIDAGATAGLRPIEGNVELRP